MTTNRITINGQTFEVTGSSVSIINGTVVVGDSTLITGLEGSVHLQWEGDLASLKTDSSVECRDVKGNVNAGGRVTCNNIEGSVNANGRVEGRGHIGKSVTANGRVTIG